MPTIKQRAEAYDAILAEILARQPSVDLVANNTTADRLSTPATVEQRFLWTFDQLADAYKQRVIEERARAEKLYSTDTKTWWPSWLSSKRT